MAFWKPETRVLLVPGVERAMEGELGKEARDDAEPGSRKAVPVHGLRAPLPSGVPPLPEARMYEFAVLLC